MEELYRQYDENPAEFLFYIPQVTDFMKQVCMTAESCLDDQLSIAWRLNTNERSRNFPA